MSGVDYRLVSRALSDEFPYNPYYSAQSRHPALRLKFRQFEYRLDESELKAPPFDRLDRIRRSARRVLQGENVQHLEVLYDKSGPIGYKAITMMGNNVEY